MKSPIESESLYINFRKNFQAKEDPIEKAEREFFEIIKKVRQDISIDRFPNIEDNKKENTHDGR